MALAATTVWEVRTTGNALNGGGFNPSRDAVNGVDYSQQDTAQLAPTDLYRVAANSLYSDSFTFTHAMEGNIIYIASGTHFTAGYYEIVTYVDATHVTLDRDPASEDTSAHKDGVGKVGGASNNPQTIIASITSGMKMHIKVGTYTNAGATQTAVLTLVNDGSAATGMIIIEGYNTTRGDNPIGANRPELDAANDETYVVSEADKGGYYWKNIIFKRATSHGFLGGSGGWGTRSQFWNCRFTANGGWGLYHGTNGGGVNLTNCEIDNNTSGGTSGSPNNDASFQYCYIHDNGGPGANHRTCYLTECIVDSNVGYGMYSANALGALNCVFYNNTGVNAYGYGCAHSNSYDGGGIVNCIAMNNGKYGISNADSSCRHQLFVRSLTYGNGTAGTLNMGSANVAVIDNNLTSDPLFTDAPNGDFTLQAGSPCLDVGFPQTPMVGATI